jgi:hypothetical protein
MGSFVIALRWALFRSALVLCVAVLIETRAQIDEARSKMRREMELAALELEASRREEAAYQAKLERQMLVQGGPKNHGLKSTGLF